MYASLLRVGCPPKWQFDWNMKSGRETILECLRVCPFVHSLNMWRTKRDEIALLESMQLQHLELTSARHIGDADMKKLLSGLPLRHLDLQGCRGITDARLAVLSELKLEYLDVMGTDITADGVRHLLAMPLRTLNMGMQNMDQALSNLAGKLPQLTSLDVVSSLVTDAGLACLKGRPLEKLSLWGCDSVTEEGLTHLKGMPLRELDLADATNSQAAGLRISRACLWRC